MCCFTHNCSLNLLRFKFSIILLMTKEKKECAKTKCPSYLIFVLTCYIKSFAALVRKW